MTNYFKIFRVRKFAKDEKEVPAEKFVFFDDESVKDSMSAAALAQVHLAELTKKFPIVRVAIWSPIECVRAHVIGDFEEGMRS